jgi:hypothetical protein
MKSPTVLSSSSGGVSIEKPGGGRHTPAPKRPEPWRTGPYEKVPHQATNLTRAAAIFLRGRPPPVRAGLPEILDLVVPN